MQRALAGLRGITKTTVDLESGEAIVQAEMTTPREAMERAVRGQVILPRVRWLLARVPLLGKETP